MESKKEALREMVGRRYRDIIEASSEVRRVRDLAQQLSASLASARSTPATGEIRLEVYPAISFLTLFCSLAIATYAFFTLKMRVPRRKYSRQRNILLVSFFLLSFFWREEIFSPVLKYGSKIIYFLSREFCKSSACKGFSLMDMIECFW